MAKTIQTHCVVALAVIFLSAPSAWAQTAAQSQAQQNSDSLVRDALARYQAGLDAIKNGNATVEPTNTGIQTNRPVREIRLADAVQLALEKNLDISVERLNPEAVDLQIAGLKKTYSPIVTSSIGQRDNYSLPRDQLQGGQRVSGWHDDVQRWSHAAHRRGMAAISP